MKHFYTFCLMLMAAALVGCAEQNPTLTIEGGQVVGVETATNGVISYKGIPYAAPPVGDLRWRAPQPVVAWEGVKVADKFGPACWQTDKTPGEFYQKEFFWEGDPERSEDCLYLNVWTPAAGRNKKLPVAVWIHGGAYTQGFGHEVEFDGEAWADKGVVLVTINYRLGIFGFYSHPDLSVESPNGVSGNYGILDQLAAITWVKNNIAAFGGDPNNITIFGQSAGAGSVQTLLASPLAQPYIKKAVIQSGGGLSAPNQQGTSLAAAEESGAAFAAHFGKDIAAMREVEPRALMQMLTDYPAATGQRLSTRPILDDHLSYDTFSNVARADKLPDIPYMIGYVTKDGERQNSAIADFALLREEQGHRPVFTYKFTRELPGDDAGAFHSSELWYLFGTLSRSWRPFVDADYKLSEQMITYWTNFVKTGDPNSSSVPEWRPYVESNRQFKILTTE
ncbi:MAG: carboxylesterase family protein [Tidjanibacter sp.]|nr:carboxylesterase family protein [Tidjanibacter sp.]